MELFHRADYVRNVFDHVNGAHMIERSVAERVRKMVNVYKHIGRSSRDAIDTYRTGILVYPATDVEDAWSRSFTRTRRHSSSVSAAKSA